MKNAQSNPIATLGGIFVLMIVGLSTKHCMKKYGRGRR